MLNLLPFQRRFLKSALAPGIRTSALSLPRGNGKSTLVAWLAARTLDPDDPLFVLGSESHIVAASIGQARRSTFTLLREFCESSERAMEYSISENNQTCQVLHKPTHTRVSVLASSGKTAQGLVRCPWVFADEPGSWETNGGQLLHDAIQKAMGKPETNLRAIYIGTLAPATSGWWHDLVSRGSHGSTHVTALRGRLAQWALARELRRVNPLMWEFPESRSVLVEERDEAKADSRHKAAFLSYHLNLPALDEEVALLTPDEWERVLARPVTAAETGCPSSALTLAAVGRGRRRSACGSRAALKRWRWHQGSRPSRRRRSVTAFLAARISGSYRPARSCRPMDSACRAGDPGSVSPGASGRDPVGRDSGYASCSDRYPRLALGDAAPHWNIELLTRLSVAAWRSTSEDIGGLRRQASDGTLGRG